MSKRFLLVLLAVGLALFGLFWLTRDKKANAPTPEVAGQVSNHTQGDAKKGVHLVEYGDFQCPACGAYHPLVKQIKQKYGNDIAFQFRHFPLPTHQNARAAHRAAEAAGMQGKFWEMHDMLYERQQSWAQSTNVATILEDYATQIGLDMEKYRQDFNSQQVNSVINADVKAGQELGANSTPTFVLNGKKLEDLPRDLEGFYKLIDEAIAQKSSEDAEPAP